MSIKLPFGLRLTDHRYIDVRSVPNGKACGCICPACEKPLVAKNSPTNLKIAHFAHASDCTSAYETVIHETAKQIIRDLGYVWLPPSVVAPRGKFVFTNHTLERRYGGIVPDVLVWNSESTKLAIEIYVTHEIGPEKLSNIHRLKLSCVEFDLSDLPTTTDYDTLKTMFAEPSDRATWIFNRKAHLEGLRRQAKARAFLQQLREEKKRILPVARAESIDRKVYVRANRYRYPIYHVDPCPKGARAGRLANVNLDCRACMFCFGIQLRNRVPHTVRCGGHRHAELPTDTEIKAAQSSADMPDLA